MILYKRPLYLVLLCLSTSILNCSSPSPKTNKSEETIKPEIKQVVNMEAAETSPLPSIDTASYIQKINLLANGDTMGLWPVKKQPYPLPGAILPFKRVVAYYGNLYSKKMGILGELPPEQMLKKLDEEVRNWEQIDPATPVQPALHYIAVVAQGDAGKDGKYRFRMPDKQIDSVLQISKMRKDMIVFLDLQVAFSTVHEELPRLEKYLKKPNVHLAIDPEFSMKNGRRPGTVIGTFDATDVNYCSDYLSRLIKENNLPPKIFIIHRFTKSMVTNTRNFKLYPEVQLVINMDGWGQPELKKGTYRHFIYSEPVQFTGFKIFYKNDLKKAPHRLMTLAELMKLKPLPIYIQYQ